MESRNISYVILKSVSFLILFIFTAGCNNKPAPSDKSSKTGSSAKYKKITTVPAVNPWTINSFAPKPGDNDKKKYVRYVTDGTFSNSESTNGYLYAELLVDKINAGIFLHESQKTNPMEKFNGPVRISMKNSEGKELQLTSSRGWNKTGGIMIENNNNDYSQFRIFMLQSTGIINVEITDAASTLYNFKINTDGFSDVFSKI